MSPAKLKYSVGTVILLSVFLFLSEIEVFLAVITAVSAHEAGHYLIIRFCGGHLNKVSISAMGLEMQTYGRLSYSQELIALLAGPLANIVLFFLFGLLGKWADVFYLFGGAQLLLGLFNLLPICGLDGSSILWIIVALLTQPNTADRIAMKVSLGFSAALLVFAGILVCRHHGGAFLLWAAIGLFLGGIRQLGLVKRQGKR